MTYTYGDSEWGDLLTAYDGKTITYDTIGNPLNDGTWSYTWQHGRQLASMSKGNTTWTYTYDANGMRTMRSYNHGRETYTYIYNGDKLTRLIVDAQECFDFTFTYDVNGTPLSLTEHSYGFTCYYVTNLQGDVIGIKDSSGQQVVTYSYDAWGNDTGHTHTQLADYNPLRYRGYVYDWETGLYYVSSRYYNPEIGRWINADDTELLLEEYETILQYNVFIYCWNNPVNMHDPDGYWTLALAGGGYLATAGTLNAWNPFGWFILGAVAVATVITVGVTIYDSVKSASDSSDPDPYARPGQKKQGRERKNKARKSKDWKPRSNPKPPKKHTPGRDHRKYKRDAYLDDN